MISTWKYNRFKHLSFGVLLYSATTLLNPAFAATTLSITQVDNKVGTVVQSYTSTNEVPATVQANNSIQFSAGTAIPETWSAEFIAPFDQKLQVTNYEEASLPDGLTQSFKSPTKPGLNISIGANKCAALPDQFDVLSGRFDVLEVTYTPQGSLNTLAIDFVQKCAGSKLELRGAIRHNSSIPLITTTPIASAGADQHVVEANIINFNATPVTYKGNQVFLTGINSSAGDGATITGYSWQQLSGASVTLSDTASATPSFIFQNIKLGGEKLEFELTVTNTHGVTATDKVTVFVTSKSEAQTSFLFESEQGDTIGKGLNLFADVDDAIITITNTDKNHAHFTIDNGNNWFAEFNAASGSSGLIAGSYNPITRHLSPHGTEAGLYIHDLKIGCKTVAGNFNVIQLNRNASNDIENLYIEFTQECDQTANILAPALHGHIKINYIDVNVPTADAGAAQTVTEATQVTLDASASNDDPGGSIAIDGYDWQQLTGTTVSLSSTTTAKPTFTAPNSVDAKNEELTFQVTVTDNEGFKAKNSVVITVEPKVIPPKPTEPGPAPVEPKPDPAPEPDPDSSLGGGGGGCSLNPSANFDGTFYLLLLLASLIHIRRKISLLKENTVL